MSTEVTAIDGFHAYTIRGAKTSAIVVPELGAKVVSLRNEVSQREWMWHPGATLKLFRNAPTDKFENSPLAGWDECMPTIAPCRWKNRALPDHGEVWALPWKVLAADQHKIALGIDLPVSPFRLERTLAWEDRTLVASYTLVNRSDEEEEYLWALHPLFAVQEGDRIEVSAATRELLEKPAWLDTLDLTAEPGGSVKTFASPLDDGHAAIVNKVNGDRLALSWNVKEHDILGIWLTRGGWHGHHHLALEPTSGMPDSLADHSRCAILPARGTRSWTVRFELSEQGATS